MIERRTPAGSVRTSCPATIAVPESGRSRVDSTLTVVVLPAPLGPRMPSTDALAAVKLIPRSACTSPKDLWTSWTTTAGSTPAGTPAGDSAWGELGINSPLSLGGDSIAEHLSNTSGVVIRTARRDVTGIHFKRRVGVLYPLTVPTKCVLAHIRPAFSPLPGIAPGRSDFGQRKGSARALSAGRGHP
ncbi:Uncharacterised protein [Mycobacteroides abscessus subsp. abscessus]|nr:Uncharacterised protein [Mycobacteroides abscessus subsp. abscessus]